MAIIHQKDHRSGITYAYKGIYIRNLVWNRPARYECAGI